MGEDRCVNRRGGRAKVVTMTRIIIADDHPLFRMALTEAVRGVAKGAEIVAVESAGAAEVALKQGSADLLCLDLHMSDSAGLSALVHFRHAFPDLPVLVISASDAPDVARRARAFGAAGFVSKSANLADLRAAIAQVLEGAVWGGASDGELGAVDPDVIADRRLASLTPAQMRVLQGIAHGLLNKQIAYEMNITEATVKAHVTAMFRKLHVINRTQAVLMAQRLLVAVPAVAETA